MTDTMLHDGTLSPRPIQGACGGGCAETVAELLAGNGRFCEGRSDHVADRVDLRLQQLHDQHPQVAVIACADSRVDPDIIFDAPLGGVFSVRIAGALATSEALASIQYAVDVLDVGVVMVIGHDGCGAVAAALGDDLPEPLRPLLDPIRDAVDAEPHLDPVHATVRQQADKVRRHLGGSPRARRDDLVVLSAVYHPTTGRVEVHRPDGTTASGPIGTPAATGAEAAPTASADVDPRTTGTTATTTPMTTTTTTTTTT